MDVAKTIIGVRGKLLGSQAREIIANIIHFMKAEAENGALIPLTNFRERVLAATKVSESSYKRILKESNTIHSGASTSFSSPRKQRSRRSTKSTLPVGEIETIRSIIHNYHIIEKRRPTLKGIYDKIKVSGLSFNGSLSTLSVVMKNMGFK